MAAPKNPNPGPAAAVRRAIGNRTAVDRLVAVGYTVLPPRPACADELGAGNDLITEIWGAYDRIRECPWPDRETAAYLVDLHWMCIVAADAVRAAGAGPGEGGQQ